MEPPSAVELEVSVGLLHVGLVAFLEILRNDHVPVITPSASYSACHKPRTVRLHAARSMARVWRVANSAQTIPILPHRLHPRFEANRLRSSTAAIDRAEQICTRR